MTRIIALATAFVLALALGGCAHPISLTPDLGGIVGKGGDKIEKKVGLVVTDEDKKVEVISPGGGGDKLSYYPYRDLETGMYVALSETFASVTKVSGAADPKVRADGIKFIFVPRLLTTSSSPSLVTWPPTQFTLIVTVNVIDDSGKSLTEVKVNGEGRAEFDDFKKDFSLAARRASADAVAKLVTALRETPALH